MKKKMISILLVFFLCVASLLSPTAAFAEETEGGTVLTIRIGDTTYENVTNGSSIIGDFDLEDLDFWIESVNGNKLENVGSKSTAVDNMGRNPLEIATIPGNGRVTVTLTYHAEDDPVVANQAYAFAVAGIVFANSEEDLAVKPSVDKVKGIKAEGKSAAVKLTWKKTSSVNGYEIQCSTNKKFKSDQTMTVTVSKSKTGYTFKKLAENKKYFIRIRAYKTFTDDLGNESTSSGKWSSVVSKTK